MPTKRNLARRWFITLFALASVAITTPSIAQTPGFAWAQSPTGLDLAGCSSKAQAAIRAAGFTNARDGTITGGNIKWVYATDDTYNAWITCNKVTSPVIFTVMVAGARGYFKSTEELKFWLRDYMLDRNPPPLGSGTSTTGGNQTNDNTTSVTKAVDEVDWCLACNGSPREKRFAFSVDARTQNIRVRVFHGQDDSGDRRVEVILYDPSGSPVLSESSGSTSWLEWSVAVGRTGRYELLLRDLDTRDGGQFAGNGGKVEVLLERGTVATAGGGATSTTGGGATSTTGGGATSATGSSKYRHVPGGYISGHNMRQISGTVDECKAACDRDSNCLSFDYWLNENKCDLSDRNSSTATVGEGSSRWDFYEKMQTVTIVEDHGPVAKPVEADWCLACAGSSREARYSFSIRGPVRNITVRVYHGQDDTGDRRVEVILYDPSGRVVLSESSGSTGWVDWTVPANNQGTYELLLRDADTSDSGRYPGNGGKVEVVLG